MIGRVKGELVAKKPSMAVVMCGGLGYEVDIPLTTGFDLPEVGEQVQLYTHHVVREDHQALHGFYRENERDLFRLLIKVNGVGPKLAMAILSTLDTKAFVECVRQGDVKSLTSIPGVGKKTAERLLIDVVDKVDHLGWLDDTPEREKPCDYPTTAISKEAESALVALGYKPKDAAKCIEAVVEDGMSVQDIIRSALKTMMPSR